MDSGVPPNKSGRQFGLSLRVLAPLLFLVTTTAAAQSPFIVDSVGDEPDAVFNDNRCLTAANTCTLRAAIEEANRTSGAEIRFNINGASVQRISPTSSLPEIRASMTIDGYTQPGAMANTLAVGSNAVLLIEINGKDAGSTTGLRIQNSSFASLGPTAARGLLSRTPMQVTAGGSIVVKGLVVNGFDGNGIYNDLLDTSILGCFIGTDAAGTAAIPNAFEGVYLAARATVGGPSPASRNLISGNTRNGIELEADGSVVQGNLIGTDLTGAAPLPNGEDGIIVPFTAGNLTIGGAFAGAGNVIAFNNSMGVDIACGDGCGTSVAILGNSIFSNGGEGIGLGNGGIPLANDPCDGDDGANHRQNYPVILVANSGSGATNIQGTLNSNPGTFRLEFFATPACDANGYGEGKTFIGLTSVTITPPIGSPERGVAAPDGNIQSCVVAFNVVFAADVPAGQAVTATATDPLNNTSEFSLCYIATAGQGVASTALTSSPNPSVFGQTVTLTATVTGVNGPTPSGFVTFKDGAAVLGSAMVNGSGVATLTISTLAIGIHPLTAVHQDGFYAQSISPIDNQTVSQANTFTALLSSANPADFGQSVTFTAVVSALVPGSGTPTGTVTFKDGGTAIGTSPLSGSGAATFSTSTLLPGGHAITATYNGDANFTPSTSSTLIQTIGPCLKPSAITDLAIDRASADVGTIYRLTWSDTLLGQNGQYEILVSVDGGPFSAVGYTKAPSFTGTVTQPPNSVLTFVVRGEPLCGQGSAFSDPSNPVTLTVTGTCPKPAAPVLAIDKTSLPQGDSFTLSWNQTLIVGLGGPLGQYRILQSINGGAFVSIGTTTNLTFTATVPSTIDPGTPVAFQVIAEPSCASSSQGFSPPSNPVVGTVVIGCGMPGTPSDVMVKSQQNPEGLPTPTDFLLVSWTAPAGGPTITRYGVRINGDAEAFTAGTSVILPPRGSRLDPITAFVRALACTPETVGEEAHSDPVALNLSPPAANFSVSPNARVGTPVTFTDTSSPQATSWLWIFDDGTTDTHQSPTHSFPVGTHQVFLIASNGAGSSSKGGTVTVAAASATTAAPVSATGEASAQRLLVSNSTGVLGGEPGRRRLSVRLSGEGVTWLKVKTRESRETVLFLRFLDGSGALKAERRLTLEGGGEGTYDLGAYGLTGEYVIELVGSQKYEASVSETRRPSPREVRR